MCALLRSRIFEFLQDLRDSLARLVCPCKQGFSIAVFPVDLSAEDLNCLVVVGGPLQSLLKAALVEFLSVHLTENLQVFLLCKLRDVKLHIFSRCLRVKVQFSAAVSGLLIRETRLQERQSLRSQARTAVLARATVCSRSLPCGLRCECSSFSQLTENLLLGLLTIFIHLKQLFQVILV